jgi:hypothetical protein
MISLIFYFQLVSVGFLGSENAQLIILIQQSQQQLAELKKMSQISSDHADALRKVMELSEHLSRGIDTVLEPYKSSREYQNAAMRVQRDRMTAEKEDSSYQFIENYFPLEAKELQRRRDRALQFQTQIDDANRSDLKDIVSFEQHLVLAEPGEIHRLAAMAGSKSWETNLRLSTQLNELLSELRALRDDLQRKDWEQKIQDSQIKHQWQQVIKRRGNPK